MDNPFVLRSGEVAPILLVSLFPRAPECWPLCGVSTTTRPSGTIRGSLTPSASPRRTGTRSSRWLTCHSEMDPGEDCGGSLVLHQFVRVNDNLMSSWSGIASGGDLHWWRPSWLWWKCSGDPRTPYSPSLPCRRYTVSTCSATPSPLPVSITGVNLFLWYKQCNSRKCWEVKLSPREVSKDTFTIP